MIVPVKAPENLSEGNRLSIMCSVTSGTPPISFVWHKDGRPIGTFPGLRVNHIDDFQDVLQIEKLTADHVGNYTCNAKNMYGSDHITVPVLLSFAPRWLSNETVELKSFVSGEAVSVDCRSAGHPTPVLRITRGECNESRKRSGFSSPRDMRESRFELDFPVLGNKEVELSPRLRLSNGVLTLIDVIADDRGNYECEAENALGKISKTVTVVLSGEYVSKKLYI